MSKEEGDRSVFVQGVQVGALYGLEPPPPWTNISGQAATRLPSFENEETGEVIRVSINQRPPTYVAWHHVPARGKSSPSDPLAEANTDRGMVDKLMEHFGRAAGHENKRRRWQQLQAEADAEIEALGLGEGALPERDDEQRED